MTAAERDLCLYVWFKSTYDMTPWDANEPFHVVCVRTANEKLVYYGKWNQSPSPPQAQFVPADFNPAGSGYALAWSTANSEYYDLTTNPGETGNAFATSPALDIQTAFPGCVSGELQANPSSISSAISAAVAAFKTYITPPSSIVVTGPIAHDTMNPVTFSFNGTNVLPGPDVKITGPGISATEVHVLDTYTGPFTATTSLPSAGTYHIVVTNPSGLIAPVANFTVS